MIYKPWPYQRHATQHIINNPAAGLFLEMGLGKTVSTATAIDILINGLMEVSKVLVIAPKRVAEDTWSTECEKWDHLQHLRISKVLGSEKHRKAALKAPADIYIINRENVAWLVALYGTAFPFDMVVIDESSSFKSHQSVRFKALKQIRPLVGRVVLLTGTPAPNTLLDLWPQIYLLDRGQRLGATITDYRNRYFRPKNLHSPGLQYEVIREKDELIGESYYERKIFQKIGDICISMKAEDYLDLPKRIDNTTLIHLPDDVMDAYLEFEESQVLALADEENISAVNAAVLSGKLQQFAGGAVYREDKTFYACHDTKLETLVEKIEALNGRPVIVTYWFKHELERIKQALKAFKPRELINTTTDLIAWNKGEIPVLLGHPASMGHGLNMQQGGHNILWYGPIWSLELYQQLIARVDRQGQALPVINDRLVVAGTIEEDIVKALNNRATGQEALMQAVKARIELYTNKKVA